MQNLAKNREQQTKAHYYRIIKGGVAYKVAEPVKNEKGEVISVAREVEKGKFAGTTVHELIFNQVEGTLFDIKIKEPNGPVPYQMELHLMHETGEVMILQCNLYTGDTCTILQKLIGIDPALPITIDFHAFPDKETKKMKYPITITNGEGTDGKPFKMVPYFDKENPNLPKWVQLMDKGPNGEDIKKGFSQTDQVNFLYNAFKTILLPNLPKFNTGAAVAPVTKIVEVDEHEDYDGDDLPAEVRAEVQAESEAKAAEEATPAPDKFAAVKATNERVQASYKKDAPAPAPAPAAAAATATAAAPAPAARKPRF